MPHGKVTYSYYKSSTLGTTLSLLVCTPPGINANGTIVQSRDSFEFERNQLQNLLRAQVEGIIASIAINTKNYAPFKEVAARVPVALFDRTFSRA